MSDNPLTLEWDEDGLHLTLDLRQLTRAEEWNDGDGAYKVAGVVSTSGAFDLYEHVRKVLAGWYGEASSARAAVAAGVTLAEYVGADPDEILDPLDPKNPAYADNLRELGDISRKAGKENRL